jgi:hypothetical protein
MTHTPTTAATRDNDDKDDKDDDAFLRALVKSSRQRTIHLKWTDRDGTARLTALTAAEATRVNALARARGIGAEALMRETAHQPAAAKPA